jgi:hypothetical protein
MGRWTKEKRESMAAQALSVAQNAARNAEIKPELPLETTAPVENVEQGQQGQEEEEIVRRPPRNDIRKRAMEEIEARDIQSKTSLGMELGLDESEKPPVKEQPKIPQDPPPPTAEDMLRGGKFSTPTVRVKVDGEEFDVPQEEVEAAGGLKTYQIQRAADNRLRKANEALAEVRKFQESKAETSKQSPDDFLQSKMEILRWGTPEESAAAMREILSKNNKPVDQNMIVEMAADRIRHDDAVKSFDKEFSDIGTSPLHLKLVVAMRNERLLQGHPGDWGNFYRSLGNEVRAVMPKQSQPSTTEKTADSTSQASDKEARKASIVNLPQAAARAALPEDPKPETRADILNQMRKTRGLPTA